MNKRTVLASLLALPVVAASAVAKTVTGNTVTWFVPKRVKQVRVRIWSRKGNLELDRTLSVKPGQKFQIDVEEDDG